MRSIVEPLFARPNATSRLFCFPYAGGGTASYRGWHTLLPDHIEVWGIQLPGREDRIFTPAFKRMGDVLNGLVPAIIPLLDRPFAVFGHSMGALVSFELTRSLEQLSVRSPTRLFVSACMPPQVRDAPNSPVHRLPDDDLIEKLREWCATPEQILRDPEMMALLLPALRADFAVIETYRYEPSARVMCPVTAFGGIGDPAMDSAVLSRWGELTTGGFDLRMFPGDHFFLHSERSALLRDIAARLAGTTEKAAR